jgi:hypothetical protein
VANQNAGVKMAVIPTPITATRANVAGARIRVCSYEPAHLAGIFKLFAQEYGDDPDAWRLRFDSLYESSYQAGHCIRVVALDGDTVVGFQSLFNWPVQYKGRHVACLQSGNTVVSREARGQGVFGKLLRYQDEVLATGATELLIGFPVAASLPGFIRNGWTHVTDLIWRARLIAPLSVMRPFDTEALGQSFQVAPVPLLRHAYQARTDDIAAVAYDAAFTAWRSQFRRPGAHYYFHHSRQGHELRFDLRLEQRGRFKVLVIGGYEVTDHDPQLVRSGLRALIGAAAGSRSITLLAIAGNDAAEGDILGDTIKLRYFFIVKPVANHDPRLLDRSNWALYRGDIDTW